MRRVDPQHRSLGQFFQDEIAAPLGLDFYIRLPADIPAARLAPLQLANPIRTIFGLPFPTMLAALTPRSVFYHSVIANPGTVVALDPEHIYARDFEVPSGGGVGTARAIARAYSVFATGGKELALQPETLRALAAPPVPPVHGFYDECMKGDIRFALGFMKPSPGWSLGGLRHSVRPARAARLAMPLGQSGTARS